MKRKGPPSDTVSGGSTTIKKSKPFSGKKVVKGSFEHRFERRRYLSQLLDEFQTTSEMECKQQIMANFANFAYDPYNYHFFQELGIVSVFLAELSVNRNQALSEFAMAGICNCVADKRIQAEILRKDANLGILKQHASSSSIETVLSLITTLITIVIGNTDAKSLITADNFSSHLMNLLLHNDKRVQNVVQILLDEIR